VLIAIARPVVATPTPGTPVFGDSFFVVSGLAVVSIVVVVVTLAVVVVISSVVVVTTVVVGDSCGISEPMFTTFLNILTMLVIGLSMKMIFLAILYILAYIPLRVYSGGYHASTPQKCWIFSAIMLYVVLWILKKFYKFWQFMVICGI